MLGPKLQVLLAERRDLAGELFDEDVAIVTA